MLKFSGMEVHNKKKLCDVMAVFKCYSAPRKYNAYQSFKFSQKKWEGGEKFNYFLTILKTLMHNCDYSDQEDNMPSRDTCMVRRYVTRFSFLALLPCMELNKFQAHQINAASVPMSVYHNKLWGINATNVGGQTVLQYPAKSSRLGQCSVVNKWKVCVKIEDKCLQLKIYTGSELNVRNTRVMLDSCGGTKFKSVVVMNLHCVVQNQK
ncbi:hypothetical protein PR048_011459 [Dryococelus australis]|uniref:Uncharacterized protein n=1 Tax=Dryococelus australis TaxID=614101 RepID=A0ABQ9HM01_9NEOP|nr:hypothetical protein PR048_011459 [Dryococelus australis]